ncbi:S-layer homology domain-containing protein [Paenibacillus doosanensis]|uniref:S-layer homology domain-containing protein n=1 Tax=Paenibacillus doosanensis TaxID=1229154 RepID=UPI00217FA931|nr:S-layer homology domain-containing protein [Paenibacillus doosanensis]
MKGKMNKKGLSKAVYIGLTLALMLGGMPAAPSAVRAAAAGTPGGVDSAGLRLWLKADANSVELAGDFVNRWKDSSPNGNDFINDGTVDALASRTKPKYVTENDNLNFQPTVKFTRSSSGSILQDVDGVFAEGEQVNNASLYTVTGGSPAMANSSIFNQPLASGSLGAYIPHTTGAAAGMGNVLWDVGTTATRVNASNIVAPNDYNVWGLHFDAHPETVGSNVYQSITRDGKQEATGTQTRAPMTGKGGAAASIGSAAGGGSGYEGNMGELILFTNPLTAVQKRQVDTYLAIKFGLTLKEGDYLSAGPSPQIVWNAAANAGYGNHIAGIGADEVGALQQTQGRSSQKDQDRQILVTAKQPLADKQYLMWGDNDSQDDGVPYGTDYKRLSRIWKVQQTGGVGTVQVAVPADLIPLGGVLLTSGGTDFGSASATPMTAATIHGAPYYVADAALASGSYFTFAEKLPDVQLTKLEIWNGAENALGGFDPGKMNGYEALVPEGADQVKIAAQAGGGVDLKLTLTNYLQADAPVADPDRVPLVPGVNRLKLTLSSGDSINVYTVDIIRKLAVAEDGRIELNAGSVTASSYQPNTNYVPANVVDGNWEDPESRWSASGQGQWLQFDLGQPQPVTYVQIAFLNAAERLSTFEILESNDPDFASSTVLLEKRKSRSLQATDSVLQPYVLSKPSTARYLRFVGYGNTASGSSGNWNSLTEVALYTGTPPVIVEPEEPTGPPQAGDVPEGPPPVLDVIPVSTAEQLQTALDQARPGIEIRLKSGSYEQNGPFVIKDKQGTAALPIRITAEEQGGALIKGNSYLHVENSSYVEVSGLVFNNGIGMPGLDYRGIDKDLAAGIKGEDPSSATVPKAQLPHAQVHPGIELYNSSNISVLRNKFALDETGQPYRFTASDEIGSVWCLVNIEGSCRIGGDHYDADRPVYTGDTPFTNSSLQTDNGTNRHFIRVEGIGSHNRIAYNDIGPKKGFGATVIYDGKEGYNVSQYDVIEYNYFHDIGPRVTNGLEAIRLGLSGLSLASGHVTIQHNLFDGLNGEDEIVSVKSSDNVIRYNTVRNSYGGIVARHGHRNSFYGNFIFGDGKTPGFSGFRIYGNDHKIYNNYMEGLTTNVIRLDGGTEDAGPDGSTNPTVKWLEGTTEQTAKLRDLPADKQTEILRGHWRQYNVEVFNNTLVNVGNNTSSFSIGGRNYQPVGTKVYNNVVYSNAGVMFNETSAAQNAPESERQIYVGNLVEGTANPTNISNAARVPASAIEKKPLQLVRSADGLIRLSASSPAIDAAKAPYLPQEDMDGQTRYNMPDAGADEYDRQIAPTNRPLTPADVGPNAGKTQEEGEAGLSALSFDPEGGLVPAFNEDVTSYQMTVPAEQDSLKVIPTAITGGSLITVSADGAGPLAVASGQPSGAIAIAAGGTVLVVTVSLPSGKSKSYTIAVQRGQGGEPSSPPTDEPIDGLRFADNAYSLKVNGTQSTVVYAVYQGSSRLLTGASFHTENPQIAAVDSQGKLTGVSQGETVVVATYKQYNARAAVKVTDDQTAGGEAGLGSLSVSPIEEMSPSFDPSTTVYNATIPYNESLLTLVPASLASGSRITVSVDGASPQTVASGQACTVTVGQGGAIITIVVSLPSGTSKTYTIAVHKGSAPPSQPGDNGSNGGDGGSTVIVRHRSGSSAAAPAPAEVTPAVPSEPGTASPGTAAPSKPSPGTTAPAEHPVFADTAGHWAESAIAKVSGLGIVNGYLDGSFKPDEPMTRLQFAVMLVRALKATASDAKAEFTDQTDIPDWALSDIGAAVQAGILQGYEDGTLRPGREINRAEMITMLARAVKRDGQSSAAPMSFADQTDIPDWARSSVSYAVSAGIVQGKEAGRFAPGSIATRAEAVTVIIRMLELQ